MGTQVRASAGLRPVLEYWLLRSRTSWRTALGVMVLAPVLYLGALGVGLGSLVDDNNPAALDGAQYLAFLAPGLLATAAMQTGFDDAAWPVQGALRWWKSYPAQQATSLRTRDLLGGHLAYIALRLTVAAVLFVAIGAVFGAFDSAGVLAAIPVAVLCGMAHVTPAAAYAVGVRSEISIAAVYRFLVLPVSLFSGAFYPVSQLPTGLEQAAYLSPLWHGVDLCRDLCLGTASWAGTGHLAYLLLWLLGGYAVAVRRYRNRLEP